MAFTVQNDDGDEVGANAYITVAEFKAYHDDRGNDYSAYSDPQIQVAIVNGTDFADHRFAFPGSRLLGSAQTTQFPRNYLYDLEGVLVEGLPIELKYAVAEYALRAAAGSLFADEPSPTGESSVKRTRSKVGPIEDEIEYETAGTQGGFVAPSFPAGDLWLVRAGFARTGAQRRAIR